ncbi:cytosolic phospholipase A2 zeta isoform X2 [Callorhinchus milii]|uniref:Cytosolic phospholipase A2 gamma-like protein n=2 Tax=Callorhinchus milii TaxID=7868 RepID=V9KLQ4_CALMI|nr:cytosolic phospholipase A2 zeta isoform X2 [Callorhinchus milii]XP_007908614.1 cytosolic phospholipase A2 zeta isoform X2 [Callorhinchus milii]|eukprot:gi/632983369/ref/XP_007908613.1/ PREDICTED: cytosolic phospholipase A2 zeta-like isoform X2 [Callorhinchus milii]
MGGVQSTSRQHEPSVRISKELSEGEKCARRKRNNVVRHAILKLTGKCPDKGREPTIAVLGSGGGLRATIAMLGTLQALADSDLLDCVSYLSGVSGSTWAMSQLYSQMEWSVNMEQMVSDLRSQITEKKRTCHDSMEYLKQIGNDPTYSLTHFWGASLVYDCLGKIETSKLSDHQVAASNGTNPYPIYAAVHGHRERHSHTTDAWFEFTPHEVGFPTPGAFVSTKEFNHKFDAGTKIKEMNVEKDLNYLQGLWGSALADKKAIWEWIKEQLWRIVHQPQLLSSSPESEQSHCEHCSRKLMEILEILNEGENFEAALSKLNLDETELCGLSDHQNRSSEYYCEKLIGNLETVNEAENKNTQVDEKRCLIPSVYMKTMRALVSWNWGENPNFAYHDSRIKELSPRGLELYEQEYLYLIDAGLENNCAYPLVLREERKVDLVLSFDFSAGDPFLTLTEAGKYCTANGIPFPDLPLELDKTPHDFYVFTKPGAPTVVHFPLFNDCNCTDGSSPKTMMDKFGTQKLSYTGYEFDELLGAASQNVSKNVGKITEQIEALL